MKNKNITVPIKKEFPAAPLTVFLVVLTLSILSSCEEVIEVNLKNAAPALTVEGVIAKDSSAKIILRYTTDYFTNREQEYEERATVTVTDDEGFSEILSYTGNGIYKGHSLVGKTGRTYTCTIATDKSTCSGTSTLNPPSEIYEMLPVPFDFQRPGDNRKRFTMLVKFKDNPSKENFYMLKIYLNRSFDGYATVDDKTFVHSDTIVFPLMGKLFHENDTVAVILYSVDKPTFNFYNQLNDVLESRGGPGGSSTPYNPASNFGKDVLGWFAAWSYVSDSVVVKNRMP